MNRLTTLLDFLKEDPEDAFTLYAIALEYLKIDEQKAFPDLNFANNLWQSK